MGEIYSRPGNSLPAEVTLGLGEEKGTVSGPERQPQPSASQPLHKAEFMKRERRNLLAAYSLPALNSLCFLCPALCPGLTLAHLGLLALWFPGSLASRDIARGF